MFKMSTTRLFLTNYLIVPCFLVMFPNIAVQIIPFYCATDFSNVSLLPSMRRINLSSLAGNSVSYAYVSLLAAWAFIWMKWLPGRAYEGPLSAAGIKPKYSGNGQLYYFTSLAVIITIFWSFPIVPILIHDNMAAIVGLLNTLACIFCMYLYAKGKLSQGSDRVRDRGETASVFFEYYRGIEHHPYIFQCINVKQFAIVRVGMISWLVVTIAFFCAGSQRKGTVDPGHFSCTVLQVVYIYKTFAVEHGFAWILDATLDRAGHYLIWGGLVWISAFYSWNSYIYANHPTNCTWQWAVITLFSGFYVVYQNYEILDQKVKIKQGKTCKIWGEAAKVMKVKYVVTENGKNVSKVDSLLYSGWWGKARKISYTFEITFALALALPGYELGWKPFVFPLYMAILTVHRIFRDEEKCRRKYGSQWDEYCSKVPYRMIPYLF